MANIIGKVRSLERLIMWPPTKAIKKITGNKYGRLLVLGTAWKKVGVQKCRYYVSCICDCGEEAIVELNKLKSGHTTSCGCYHKEKILKAVTKHGESNWGYKQGKKEAVFHLSYSKWQSVKARCLYPSTKGYARYGAIGITICEGYINSYQLFRDDLGERPTPEHTLDRKDTFGSYSCGKCSQCKKNGWEMNIRWADRETQNNNKRNAVWIEYNGKKMTATQWGKELGISGAVIRQRYKNGWSPADILSKPLKQKK